MFICFSGISLAFLFVLLVCYCLLFFLFVWYFNIIARSAFLALACLFPLLFLCLRCVLLFLALLSFLFSCFLVVFFCYVYAILFAPCSGNAERGNVRAGREGRRNGGKGTPGGLVLLCLIAVAIGA